MGFEDRRLGSLRPSAPVVAGVLCAALQVCCSFAEELFDAFWEVVVVLEFFFEDVEEIHWRAFKGVFGAALAPRSS